uniref:Transmembrane protein 179B n=1 Tax=Electrophorus electricus TaxID=8005 RepID=A0AAY5EU14_ELEEL
MGLPWLVTLELVLYAGCFICGIIAAASVTITQGHFAGQCILYGSIHYNTSSHFLTVEISSSPSLCYFVSAISVCVAIYCFSLIFFWIYAGCVDEEVKRMWLNVSLGMCGLLMFLLLVSGCIVRIGRDSLCLSALHNVPSISRCSHPSPKMQQVTAAFPSPQRSVWVSIFFWLLIMAVVMVQRRQVVGENTMWSHAETEPFFRRPARNL